MHKMPPHYTPAECLHVTARLLLRLLQLRYSGDGKLLLIGLSAPTSTAQPPAVHQLAITAGGSAFCLDLSIQAVAGEPAFVRLQGDCIHSGKELGEAHSRGTAVGHSLHLLLEEGHWTAGPGVPSCTLCTVTAHQCCTVGTSCEALHVHACTSGQAQQPELSAARCVCRLACSVAHCRWRIMAAPADSGCFYVIS